MHARYSHFCHVTIEKPSGYFRGEFPRRRRELWWTVVCAIEWLARSRAVWSFVCVLVMKGERFCVNEKRRSCLIIRPRDRLAHRQTYVLTARITSVAGEVRRGQQIYTRNTCDLIAFTKTGVFFKMKPVVYSFYCISDHRISWRKGWIAGGQ